MSELLRILRYVRPYVPSLLGSVVLMAFAGAAHGLIALLIQPIFDQVLPSRENLVPGSIALLAMIVMLLLRPRLTASGELVTLLLPILAVLAVAAGD